MTHLNLRSMPLAAAVVLTLLMTAPAHAQFQKPEDAIDYRQSAFTVLASHFGRVAAMAQGKVPFDPSAAMANTAIARTMAPLPFAGFAAGTDKGLPQRAKPEVWSDAARFKTLSEDMVAAMAKLDTAAKTGDLEQVKAAVGATGKACKACHDDFRAEKFSSN